MAKSLWMPDHYVQTDYWECDVRVYPKGDQRDWGQGLVQVFYSNLKLTKSCYVKGFPRLLGLPFQPLTTDLPYPTINCKVLIWRTSEKSAAMPDITK